MSKKQPRKVYTAEETTTTVVSSGKKKADSIGFDLALAKKYAKQESANQPRKLIYVKVERDGTFDISTFGNKDNVVHCYRGGQEIPITFKKISSEDVDSQTSNMEKKAAKKVAGKVSATKKEESKKDSKPVGNSGPPLLQHLTEKQYQELLKKEGNIRQIVAKAVISYYKL